jgi:starch synthase
MTPYSRSGQIGDVCAALPRALRGLDHKVTVVMPLWTGGDDAVDPNAHALARRLSTLDVQDSGPGGETTSFTLFDGRTTGGVDLVLIGHDTLFERSPGDPESKLTDAAFALGQAAAELARVRDDDVDVVHAHGYFGAAALPLFAASLPNATRVLSLHDARARGVLDAAALERVPAAVREAATTGTQRGGGEPSLLRAGIAAAQRVVADSQAAAEALLQADDGPAPTGALSEPGKLVGIANGLDASRWNPLTDALLPARFDPVDSAGRNRCKDTLQADAGLAVRDDVPVLTVVADEGIELLLGQMEALLRNDVQVVVVGAEGAAMERLDGLTEEYPERLALLEAADERTLHRSVAGADFLLITAQDPRLGDLHLAAQQYGALPVVPAVGALLDAVVDCEASLATGSGFHYAPGDGENMLSAVQRALSAFGHEGFEALRKRTMQLDLSWERVARRYEHAYRRGDEAAQAQSD